YQPKFFAGAGAPEHAREEAVPTVDRTKIVMAYIPALLKASVITIVLSCAAMALAIFVGVLIASGRVYGNALVRTVLTAYVEVVRGTPVLLQLFVLYYGLSAVIRLPAFVAALLGLGLNYAAYESEIYRGALEAVPRGQLEAARTLGLTEMQVLRLVRGPQAFRLALPPLTNDFVALLKDSSLVSVITVIELTKQTQIFAANIGSWVIPGALCAVLYLAMSLPLSRLAGVLEMRWRAATEGFSRSTRCVCAAAPARCCAACRCPSIAASSWRSWASPAAARRPYCDPSPRWSRSTRERSTSTASSCAP